MRARYLDPEAYRPRSGDAERALRAREFTAEHHDAVDDPWSALLERKATVIPVLNVGEQRIWDGVDKQNGIYGVYVQ